MKRIECVLVGLLICLMYPNAAMSWVEFSEYNDRYIYPQSQVFVQYPSQPYNSIQYWNNGICYTGPYRSDVGYNQVSYYDAYPYDSYQNAPFYSYSSLNNQEVQKYNDQLLVNLMCQNSATYIDKFLNNNRPAA